MRSERDTTRIVRSWLESGSTAVPDRVLDAVLSELPSMPQRRSRWTPWRSQRMNTVVRIAAVAAAGLVMVVVGARFLPGGSNVGGPAGGNTISGQITFALGDDEEVTVDVEASANGSTLSGSATVSYGEDAFTIALQCARRFDDLEVWLLGGEIAESTPGAQEVGMRSALLLRDGSPQQAIFWFEDPPPAEDCPAFAQSVPTEAIEKSTLSPVKEGEISIPADLGG